MTNNARFVTLGEIMVRLSPPGYKRIVQAEQFDACYGGAEANVAVSLSVMGEKSRFVTKLPKNLVADAAVNTLKRYGVDTDRIVYGGDRVGIYYAEKGASQRSSVVVYDRKWSSISTAEVTDFDFDDIFSGAEWFHFTGITPALSDSTAAVCLAACKAAHKAGLTVSCDLNFRSKLWSREKANEVMSEICKYVDVCIANEEDALDVFGIKASGFTREGGTSNNESYIEVAEALQKRFNFKAVAITLRKSINASINGWSAMLYTDGKAYFGNEYEIHLVDRVGGGDAFGAGLIYALANKYEPIDAVNYATAAGCLAQTMEGDFNLASKAEIEKIAAGNVGGRISR